MGSKFEDSSPSERPAHVVRIDDFYIASTSVTNQEYRDFVNCTGYKAPVHWQRGSFRAGTARHPVTNVTWKDAKAYAEWAEVRLPTEAEWEKAVRGDDERLYPWGSRWLDDRCNCMNRVGSTLPVDEFPVGRSAYGLWDTVGNAYEWCEDYYDKDYYKDSPDDNPKGPDRGEERVIRGGCYMENKAGVRAAHRAGASESYARDSIGFRTAMSPKDS
jgi:iron(II)-dependent oxidoreductase